MKTTAAALLALGVLAPALAQDVDRDDIPRECEAVCANIVPVSDDCDRRFDRDSDELACMCQADNAREVVPLCAACVEFYDSDDDDDDNDRDDDNDVGELRRDCNFASTTFNPSSTYGSMPQMTAATNINGASSGNASPPSPTSTANQGPLSSALDSISSDLSTATSTNQASLSSVISSVSSDLAPTPTSDSVNAATNNDGSHAALAGAALLAAAALF